MRTLLDTPGRHVRHRITLAHLGRPGDAQMMAGESRVAGRITGFVFDDPAHFTPDAYDVVMLFGFASRYASRGPGPGLGTASDGQPYPADRLADPELAALVAYMDGGGGGLFATGDHGELGRALSHAVPRVRNMRLWQSTPAQGAPDEVSMAGPHRNDTNQGSLFDHQSDDVPQIVEPRLYSGGWLVPATFPHPLLCGPDGVIRMMPDHPHEGQCTEPADTTLVLAGGPEYPAAVDGGPRPLPEVISTNHVRSGNTAVLDGVPKSPTVAQSFGGICAYDGHRAGIGRVVTDATWHHFVNVNFRGLSTAANPPFDKGFLTPSGEPALRQIRAYHRNVVRWATRPERIRCINTRLAFTAVFSGRVLEAVLTVSTVRLAGTGPAVLGLIGRHARDALGRIASRCQSYALPLQLILRPAVPRLVPDLDPWLPPGHGPRPPRPQWFDGTGLLDIALGAALVGLHEAVGEPTPETVAELDTDRLADILAEAGRHGVQLAVESLRAEADVVRERIG